MSNTSPQSRVRLNSDTLGELSPELSIPRYQRSPDQTGILHLGPGAFHRAHQAAYLDDLLGLQVKGWGICAVSLQSTRTRDLLAEQDFLYTLTTRDKVAKTRVIGSIFSAFSAAKQQQEVLRQFNSPGTRIVSMTITEKGYCLSPAGDLDTAHPAIQRDFKHPGQPATALGYLVEGYRIRRQSGYKAFTALSCDNLAENGLRLGKAVVQFARELDPDLARWIEDNARFPNTMVDSITPATDDSLRADIASSMGLIDEVPVQREAFSQWVIEDDFPAGRPPLEDVGVTLTDNVEPFEKAKLRILNGAHSALAFVGLLQGHATVSQAMRDKLIRAFVASMIDDEVLGSLSLPGLEAYTYQVFERFENPSIEYQLLQIAGDSSQKIPFRIMGTVRDNLKAGRPVGKLAVCIAAWLQFVRRQHAAGIDLDDPMNQEIRQCTIACTGDAGNDLLAFAQLSSVLSPGVMNASPFRQALEKAYETIESGHLTELLSLRQL